MTTTTIEPGYLEQYKDKEWMETYTGQMFSVTAPNIEHVNIFDIAHSLAYKCRYNGHTREFFSVAEHCVTLAYLARYHNAPVSTQFQLLMHDAGETWLPDVPRPIKHLFPELILLERTLDAMVRTRFGLEDMVPPIVKEWDSRILRDERRGVMMPSSNAWQIDVLEPLRVAFACWEPAHAEAQFLDAYQTISAGHHGKQVLFAYDPGEFEQCSSDTPRKRQRNYKFIDVLGGCACVWNGKTQEEGFHFEQGDFSIVRPASLGAPVNRDR